MCRIGFCEDGANCQGSCPVSAHNGVPGALNASNGQSCYWFSNGCTVGCDVCDGTQNHVGHGQQRWLYKNMSFVRPTTGQNTLRILAALSPALTCMARYRES